MIWGGGGGNREKKISEALLQEKRFDFSSTPQIINGLPLILKVKFMFAISVDLLV